MLVVSHGPFTLSGAPRGNYWCIVFTFGGITTAVAVLYVHRGMNNWDLDPLGRNCYLWTKWPDSVTQGCLYCCCSEELYGAAPLLVFLLKKIKQGKVIIQTNLNT